MELGLVYSVSIREWDDGKDNVLAKKVQNGIAITYPDGIQHIVSEDYFFGKLQPHGLPQTDLPSIKGVKVRSFSPEITKGFLYGFTYRSLTKEVLDIKLVDEEKRKVQIIMKETHDGEVIKTLEFVGVHSMSMLE